MSNEKKILKGMISGISEDRIEKFLNDDLWVLGEEISSISNRIQSVMQILSLIAESLGEDTVSGSVWGCEEMLEVYTDKLEDIAEKLRQKGV